VHAVLGVDVAVEEVREVAAAVVGPEPRADAHLEPEAVGGAVDEGHARHPDLGLDTSVHALDWRRAQAQVHRMREARTLAISEGVLVQ
jgi:hypothetical protein